MNEFNDIDRALADAFAQRPSTLSRPSLRDVKRRARRHQRQRTAGLVGACAIVGVGGAAVLATRSTPNQTAIGDGDPTESTICFPTMTPTTFTATTIEVFDTIPSLQTSTVPHTTIFGASTTMPLVAGTYTIAEGDYPGLVAEMFQVTVAELDAVNRDVNGYGPFLVGTVIYIPPASPSGTTFPTAWTTTTLTSEIRTIYVIQQGDTPTAVANAFDLTLEELNDANVDRPGYAEWAVGSSIIIPNQAATATTTSGLVDSPTSFVPVEVTCIPVSPTTVVDTTSPATVTTFTFLKIGTAIQVVNCSSQEGTARQLSDALTAEGFTLTEPDTGTIDLPVTKVLYNPDDPNALLVAQSVALLLGNAVVEPSGPVVPTLTTGTWAPGSGVLVLLGDDLAGKSLAEIAGIDATGSTVPTTTFAP